MHQIGNIVKPKLPWGIILLLLLLAVGCSASTPRTQTPPTADQGKIPGVSQQPVSWKSDGEVSENEYTQFQQIGDLQVFSRVEGEYVFLALRAQNNGYIALGIRPDNKMQGADMLLCSLNGSQAIVTDAYSTGPFGPHPADIELGGTSDVLDASGSNQNGWVAFEFKRKLRTGDSKDKDLILGDNPVIWATGISADINSHHKNRGYGNLVLKP